MHNIDIIATIKKNVLATIFLAVGVILVIVGLSTVVPDVAHLTNTAVKKMNQYIAGTISKSVYISVGALISCVSALKMKIVTKEEK